MTLRRTIMAEDTKGTGRYDRGEHTKNSSEATREKHENRQDSTKEKKREHPGWQDRSGKRK